jgi:hypothetical protein
MKVKQIVSGVESNLTKDEFEALQKSGHARNLEVVEGSSDYQPAELSLPTAKDKDKPAAKAADQPKAV